MPVSRTSSVGTHWVPVSTSLDRRVSAGSERRDIGASSAPDARLRDRRGRQGQLPNKGQDVLPPRVALTSKAKTPGFSAEGNFPSFIDLPSVIHEEVASRLAVKDVLTMRATARGLKAKYQLSAAHHDEFLGEVRDRVLFAYPSPREVVFDRLLAATVNQSEQFHGPMLDALAQHITSLPFLRRELKFRSVLAEAKKLPETPRLAVLKHMVEVAIIGATIFREEELKSLINAGRSLSETGRISLLEKLIEMSPANAHFDSRDKVFCHIAGEINALPRCFHRTLFDALAEQVCRRAQICSGGLTTFQSVIQTGLALPGRYRESVWRLIETQVAQLQPWLQTSVDALLNRAREVR